MVQRRTVPALALLILGAGTLAACSGGEDAGSGGGSATEAAAGPVDLRMTVWTASEDHLALFDEIAAEYVEENPDTVSSVTFEAVPFEDYTTNLTTQLAVEMGPKVRVNAVAPAVVKTRFAEALYEGREEQVAQAYPMKRLGVPEDTAKAAAFLLSDDASWITGETLVVDGGVTVAGR